MSDETAVLDPPMKAPKASKGKDKPKKSKADKKPGKPPKKGDKPSKTSAASVATPKTSKVAATPNGKCSVAEESGYISPGTYQRVADMLKCVSDKTRLQIVQMVGMCRSNVGDICKHVKQSQPAVSHHLALLRHSGVVEFDRDGKNNYYSLTRKGEAIDRAATCLFREVESKS